jgi:hypothetical protein
MTPMRCAARHLLWFAMTSCAMSLVGCLPVAKPAGQPLAMPPDSGKTPAPPTLSVQTSPPMDAQETGQQYFQLEFVQLALPLGQVSQNADFWKPFDETFLGFEVHAALDANGLRVGRAPRSELQALRNELQDAEQSKSSLVGTVGRDFEMNVRGNVERQTVNVFDLSGRQSMRDYDRCENLFAVNFRQTPRQPDRVQLSIAPAVREQKQRLAFDPGTGTIEWQQARSIYDLSIRLDLGADECLVISPSPRALDNSLAVGRIFLMEERPASIVEKVLVIVPILRTRVEATGR